MSKKKTQKIQNHRGQAMHCGWSLNSLSALFTFLFNWDCICMVTTVCLPSIFFFATLDFTLSHLPHLQIAYTLKSTRIEQNGFKFLGNFKYDNDQVFRTDVKNQQLYPILLLNIAIFVCVAWVIRICGSIKCTWHFVLSILLLIARNKKVSHKHRLKQFYLK